MKSISYTTKVFWLYVFLMIVTFLGDIFRRISYQFSWSFNRYTSLSKVIFILVTMAFLFAYWDQVILNKTRRHILYASFGLLVIFISGQYINTCNFSFCNYILENFEYFSKYMFLPFLLFVFLDLRDEKQYLEKAIKIFEILFFINIGAILIGAVFEIGIFKTYYFGNRFGYKGIYSMSGQTSFYFILMIFYYMHKLLNGNSNKWIISKLFVVIMVSLLIGTKRIYLFLPLLLIYYLIALNGYKKNSTYVFGAITLAVFLLFNKSIMNVYHNFFDLFNSIYLEKGFLSSFTSFRNDLLKQILNNDFKGFWSIILGGLNFSHIRSQMGFFDLFFFFGIFGFLIYIYFYAVLWRIKKTNHLHFFFFIILTVGILIADGFILDTNVPILLFLITSYLYINQRDLETRTV